MEQLYVSLVQVSGMVRLVDGLCYKLCEKLFV